VYSKKEIIIATIISLVIIILCAGLILTAILVASIPPAPTAQPSGPIPLPVDTEDIISTLAETMIGGGAGPVSQFNADVQYVLDTSAIACLITLILVLGVIIGLEIYNRRKSK
jgi:hypothetical protein